MTLLDGKTLSKTLKQELKIKTSELETKYQVKPTMAIVLVGDNSASEIYVRNKIKAAAFVGIEAKLIKLDKTISEQELLNLVDELNNNSSIHGIIVQLPLPSHINEQTIIDKISATKDIDGFGALNKGKLFSGLDAIPSATPAGIMHLLKAYNIEISGKEAVVVGRSNIVGKPIALLLLNENATVTIAHSKTKDLKEVTKKADILVVAVGKPKFITKDMVKDGAVVIDVGINRIDSNIYGDVDFDEVSKKASYITPVPGGVGPLTIVSLLENTLTTYQKIMEEK